MRHIYVYMQHNYLNMQLNHVARYDYIIMLFMSTSLYYYVIYVDMLHNYVDIQQLSRILT